LIFGLNQKDSLCWWSRSGGDGEIRSKPSAIQPHVWYKVRISLRGPKIRIELDNQSLVTLTSGFSESGTIALKCWDCAGRFRNFKVTAPDGTIRWEGPPDLP
jgi:hypothetical protein